MHHPCYHIYGQRIHRGLPRLATFQKSLLPHQRHKDFAMIQLPIGIAKFSEERRNSGYQSNSLISVVTHVMDLYSLNVRIFNLINRSQISEAVSFATFFLPKLAGTKFKIALEQRMSNFENK